MRLVYVLLALIVIILILAIVGCRQLSATCFETTSTSSEAPPHLHAWCIGEQYTKPYCDAEGECHTHKFDENSDYTELGGVGPHKHKIR